MPLPDLIEIVPLAKPVRAEITVPGSKSITNRALILAALADGETTLQGALWSEDTQVMVEALRALGFEVRVESDPAEFSNRTITVKGLGGRIPNVGTAEKPLELFVGNAGTAARFLAALVCLGRGVYRLSGVPRMHERPQAALFKAIRELGYPVEAETDRLPGVIYGQTAVDFPRPARNERGEGQGEGMANKTASSPRPSPPSREEREKPGRRSCTVSITESSQFASALLLCARVGGWEVEVVGENAEESPYVAMTSRMIEVFPKAGGVFQIEPDASSGSYFWGASQMELVSKRPIVAEYPGIGLRETISYDSRPTIKVVGWPRSGWQMDARYVDYFVSAETLTPHFASSHDGLSVAEIEVRRATESECGMELHLSRTKDLGDSIMIAIVLAPLLIMQRAVFTDLGRLRLQECERVVALRTELTKCGAKVVEEGDTLTVYPSRLHGAEIETYNDHRMAMCFAILGLKVPGIKLKNPACVKKTFPNFFQKLAAPPPGGLGAEIRDGHTGRRLEVNELFAE